MKVTVTPTFALVQGRIPLEVWTDIQETLSYSLSTKTWRGWESSTICLALPQPDGSLAFPSGLFHRVHRLLATHGATAEHFSEPDFITKPAILSVNGRLADGTQLRPEQITVADIAWRKRRGLFSLATNFGKTETMAAIIAEVQRPTLVLVHRKGLREDLVRRFSHLLPRGMVTNKYVTVSTVQSMARALARDSDRTRAMLRKFEVVLADEVHAVSPQWFPILGACDAAWMRLGFSGTVREARVPLLMEAFFGPILHEVTDPQLVALGRSAATTVLMPYIGHRAHHEEYVDEYDGGIVRHAQRNAVLVDFAAHAANLGHAVLMYYYRHPHGDLLRGLCRARVDPQHRVLQVDGRSPLTLLQAVRADAGAGTPGVYLLGSGLTEGIDAPGARVMINAAAWKSPGATSQRGGRIVRAKVDGGNWALIVDPYDLASVTLKRHAKARERTYTKKGFAVQSGSPTELLQTFVHKLRP